MRRLDPLKRRFFIRLLTITNMLGKDGMIEKIDEEVKRETKEITRFMRERARHVEEEVGIEFEVFGEGEWTDVEPQTPMENAIYDEGYLAGFKECAEKAKKIIES